MTARILPAAVLVAALLATSGCKQAATRPGDAPAEVLSGTISDAMLPYDQVTSQPPLDPRVVRTGRPGAEPDAEASEGAPDPAAPTPSAAVVPGPAPAPAE